MLSLLIGMIKHSQITQSNKFAISLQYLEKKVMYALCMRLCMLCMQLALSLLMEVNRRVQSNPEIGSSQHVCNILRKRD